MSVEMDDVRATAQAVVTLILHGDRAAASDLVLGHRHPGILALVLADLVTYVHTSWFHVSARALGMDLVRRHSEDPP